MGQPGSGNAESPVADGGKRREVKHLSTSRKRKRSDFPSSGERTGKSLNRHTCKSASVVYAG